MPEKLWRSDSFSIIYFYLERINESSSNKKKKKTHDLV